MPGHWLVKSEPDTWSWADQVKCGAKGTQWDGVRNNAAALHLKAMSKGDLCFFYHSGDERRIVGIVEVTKTAYPDPSDEAGRFVMVDVKAVGPVPEPVTLAAIKADKKLQDMVLIKQGRLSVSPVTPAQWAHICKMGGVKSSVGG